MSLPWLQNHQRTYLVDFNSPLFRMALLGLLLLILAAFEVTAISTAQEKDVAGSPLAPAPAAGRILPDETIVPTAEPSLAAPSVPIRSSNTAARGSEASGSDVPGKVVNFLTSAFSSMLTNLKEILLPSSTAVGVVEVTSQRTANNTGGASGGGEQTTSTPAPEQTTTATTTTTTKTTTTTTTTTPSTSTTTTPSSSTAHVTPLDSPGAAVRAMTDNNSSSSSSSSSGGNNSTASRAEDVLSSLKNAFNSLLTIVGDIVHNSSPDWTTNATATAAGNSSRGAQAVAAAQTGAGQEEWSTVIAPGTSETQTEAITAPSENANAQPPEQPSPSKPGNTSPALAPPAATTTTAVPPSATSTQASAPPQAVPSPQSAVTPAATVPPAPVVPQAGMAPPVTQQPQMQSPAPVNPAPSANGAAAAAQPLVSAPAAATDSPPKNSPSPIVIMVFKQPYLTENGYMSNPQNTNNARLYTQRRLPTAFTGEHGEGHAQNVYKPMQHHPSGSFPNIWRSMQSMPEWLVEFETPEVTNHGGDGFHQIQNILNLLRRKPKSERAPSLASRQAPKHTFSSLPRPSHPFQTNLANGYGGGPIGIAGPKTGGTGGTFKSANSNPSGVRVHNPASPNSGGASGISNPASPNAGGTGGILNPSRPNAGWAGGILNPARPNAGWAGGILNPARPNAAFASSEPRGAFNPASGTSGTFNSAGSNAGGTLNPASSNAGGKGGSSSPISKGPSWAFNPVFWQARSATPTITTARPPPRAPPNGPVPVDASQRRSLLTNHRRPNPRSSQKSFWRVLKQFKTFRDVMTMLEA